MKKSDQINLCIGKCFNNSQLSEEDVICMTDLDQSSLIIEHGLNQDQSNFVLNWFRKECQRIETQKSLHPREEE